MARYFLSAFSDEYADDLNKQCEALNHFGFSYMELRLINGRNVSTLSDQEAEEVKRVLDEHKIKVSSIGSPLGKTLPQELDEKQAERVFRTAKILGADYVRVFSFYSPEGESESSFRNGVFKGMQKIVEIGEKYHILPCHENEAKIYGESPAHCLELIEYFHGGLGCVFDMGNFVLDGFDAMQAYQLLKSKITYFHIKDSLAAGAVVPAGKGEARIRDILKDYAEQGKKDTFITLEPHLQTFSGLNALVGKNFETPYKYPNQEEAFADAVRCLHEVL